MTYTRQHWMALMNYFNKASTVVPVTMAESAVLMPLVENFRLAANDELDVIFEEAPKKKQL